MKEIITASILFLIAILAFALSVHSFCGKGFLLNNAYLYAPKQEREMMDKKPYYRQSAVVFLLIGCIFALNGFSILLRIDLISHIASTGVFGAISYAIVSRVLIEKRKK